MKFKLYINKDYRRMMIYNTYFSNKHKKKSFFILGLFLTVLNIFASTKEVKYESYHTSVSNALEQAHTELWSNGIDKFGIILDYVADLPTPEDCILGKPNAIGWWSPIENGPMFTGLYLPAMCEKARRSNSDIDKENARKLAKGLLKCSSVSEVPGFIARGVGSDGHCHYPMGSDDQTHPWFYGLYVYLKSEIPSGVEKEQIIREMEKVANVLQANDWQCPCDGDFKSQFRGSFKGHLFRDAVRYLFILKAMSEVTNQPIWQERYNTALFQKPEHSDLTRLEISSLGYEYDLKAIPDINISNLWIYVGTQGSLAQLVTMEEDPKISAQYKLGIELDAIKAFSSVHKFHEFNNHDTKVFGHSKWREGYNVWFKQTTQKEAEKLAKTGDKAILGERKSYEARYVKHPLAAATILAFSGNDNYRHLIESIICHYDYSKLSMNEYFLAECAYYAFPIK